MTRAVAGGATLALVPTVVCAAFFRHCIELGIVECAVLSASAAYAVFIGVYANSR